MASPEDVYNHDHDHDHDPQTYRTIDETLTDGTNRSDAASKSEGNAPEVTSSSSTSEPPSNSTTRTFTRSSTTPLLSAASSSNTSPKASREGSPVRPSAKSNVTPTRTVNNRSRKNSQDLSPLRTNNIAGPSIPTVPSAAAIQRALSAAGTPHFPPPSSQQQDGQGDGFRAQKGGKSAHPSGSRTGPSNSRVSSPPPSAASKIGKISLPNTKKVDHSQSVPATPSIVVDRPSKSATESAGAESDAAEEEYFSKAGMRTPVRGMSVGGPALETVQESSLPSTPATNTSTTERSRQAGKAVATERPERIDENPMEDALDKEVKSKTESGNESSGHKNADAKSSNEGKDLKKVATINSTKPPTMQSKKSFTQLPLKGKAAPEGSVKNLTVETETVSSIPQVAVGGGTGERNLPGRSDNQGSLRLKPSNETIRPKKEKKRAVRKPPSLHSGTGRSILSKHFHHHHVPSRPASPSTDLSLSTTPPSSVFSRWTWRDESTPRLRSIDCSGRQWRCSFDSDDHSPTRLPSPIKRKRSILTSLRGHSASSKADIFEAKVASAVGEADSSDSEETFVYESNPPEPHSSRPHRFHSRTPSTASIVSQLDYHKSRQDGHHSLVGKKSMKFSNNYYNIAHANAGDSTVRGPGQTSRTNTPHHHHIGRSGRDARGGHPSLFDSDSPFSNASKQSRLISGNGSQPSSRQSPRTSHFLKLSGGAHKGEESSSYDLEGEGADDERTPLVGSIKTGRNRRRPIPGSVRHMYVTDERRSRFCGRATAFTALGSVLAVLIAVIVVILIMCSKSLVAVHIRDIRNVIASESELMLDLNVHAINPNLVAVQITDLDVNIFAKSKHVASSDEQSSDAHSTHSKGNASPSKPKSHFSAQKKKADRPRPIISEPEDIISHLYGGGVDEGTDPWDPNDPDPDPAMDSQTMLLGQIFSFDSPLSFDPSPIKHNVVSSIGEVRLAKPGNRTEEGGSKRWEGVLLHDFELIVRGVLRYSPPVSSMTRSVTVHGSIIVHPNEEAADGTGNMRTSPPERPQGMDPGSNVIVKRPPPMLTDSEA